MSPQDGDGGPSPLPRVVHTRSAEGSFCIGLTKDRLPKNLIPCLLLTIYHGTIQSLSDDS